MKNILGKLVYIFERLKEPGSQRALMFLCGIFQVPQVSVDNWLGVATLIFGAIAVFIPEGVPESKVTGYNK